ncbi:MAG: glucose 1-dehydrogenase [Rhodospirillales bacterium]|nr:glucose 1-dehydrogenase [Rhodospirillales bacterium]
MILDKFSLAGKSGIVTGASRGIGAAFAQGLLEAGGNVVIADILKDKAAEKADELNKIEGGGRAIGALVDMRSRDSIQALVDKTVAEFGTVDFLFNNAGTIHRMPSEDFDLDVFEEELQVNLVGPFALAQACARVMIAHKHKGKIVNTSSLIAVQGGRTVPAYAASKGGLTQITKTMCNDWAQYNILVNAIGPGWVETENTAALRANTERFEHINTRIPLGRWAKPEDLAGAAVFLASDASDYVTGHVLFVDGGWLAF